MLAAGCVFWNSDADAYIRRDSNVAAYRWRRDLKMKRKGEKLDSITANTNKGNDIKMSSINREENKKIKY